MSLLKAIKAQLGLSNTPANNFTITAEADNGTLKLARGNAGATTQDILTVDAGGKPTFPQLTKTISAQSTLEQVNGLIIKTGSSAGGGEPFGVTFTSQFPTACLFVGVQVSVTSDPGASVSLTVSAKSATGFSVLRMEGGATTVSPFDWVAIGY